MTNHFLAVIEALFLVRFFLLTDSDQKLHLLKLERDVLFRVGVVTDSSHLTLNATELDQHEVGVSPSADSTPAGFTNVTPTDTQGALEGTPQLFGGATQSSHFTPTSASANRDTWNEPRSPSKGRESFIGLGIWNDDDVEQLAVHFLATEREHSTSLEAAIERHLEGLRLDVVSSSRPLVPSAQ